MSRQLLEKAIDSLRIASVTISSCQFAKGGGTEVTEWGICPECYGADWKGHNKDCQLAKNIQTIHNTIDELEKELKGQ